MARLPMDHLGGDPRDFRRSLDEFRFALALLVSISVD